MTSILATVMWKLAQPQNLLAILGGATLGGWITGVVTGVAVRSTGARIIPAFVLWILRVLGALVVGWVVALYILGMGQGGLGGSGGLGFGEGKGDPVASGTTKDDTKDKVPDKEQTKVTLPESQGLHIEVLNDAEIKQAGGDKALRDERYYRVRHTRPEALLTLQQILEKIDTDKPPYRKVYIVLGMDRPDRDVPRVSELVREVKRRQINPEYTAP